MATGKWIPGETWVSKHESKGPLEFHITVCRHSHAPQFYNVRLSRKKERERSGKYKSISDIHRILLFKWQPICLYCSPNKMSLQFRERDTMYINLYNVNKTEKVGNRQITNENRDISNNSLFLRFDLRFVNWGSKSIHFVTSQGLNALMQTIPVYPECISFLNQAHRYQQDTKVNGRRGYRFESQGTHKPKKKFTLWINASAKCINVVLFQLWT